MLQITDFFLFGILAFIWIDILNIKRGNALSSVFALGGAGTLALTLALQDLAKRVINGLAISTSDAFEVGDEIRLGDGTSGIVLSVGWLSTVIRGELWKTWLLYLKYIISFDPNQINLQRSCFLTKDMMKSSQRFRTHNYQIFASVTYRT